MKTNATTETRSYGSLIVIGLLGAAAGLAIGIATGDWAWSAAMIAVGAGLAIWSYVKRRRQRS